MGFLFVCDKEALSERRKQDPLLCDGFKGQDYVLKKIYLTTELIIVSII